MGAPKKLSGVRFGKLVADHYAGDGKWFCRCDCGQTTTVITTNLTKGNTTSCGCRFRETHVKHGMSNTQVYRAWVQMVRRCENPKDPAFHNYGGRGIKVCERWHDFMLFITDMGARPAGFQIDRENNDGNYEPGNCRWVTYKINRNNQRTNRLVTVDGRTQTIAQWADERKLNYRTLNNRINRGWSAEDAITQDVQKRRPPRKPPR